MKINYVKIIVALYRTVWNYYLVYDLKTALVIIFVL